MHYVLDQGCSGVRRTGRIKFKIGLCHWDGDQLMWRKNIPLRDEDVYHFEKIIAPFTFLQLLCVERFQLLMLVVFMSSICLEYSQLSVSEFLFMGVRLLTCYAYTRN